MGTTTTNSKRVILHVANNSSDPTTASSVVGGPPHTFCHSLDGNLTDVESDEDEDKDNKDETASKASSDPKVPQPEQASSTSSHSSISTEGLEPQPSTSFNKTSADEPPASTASASGVLNISSAKLSDPSTEDLLASNAVDENQPIDYTKKTLSSSSNNSSSSSLVSPDSSSSTTTTTSTSSSSSSNRSSSRKPSGFCVENLIARSPPRATSSACNQIEITSASKTPYHPEIEETTKPDDDVDGNNKKD